MGVIINLCEAWAPYKAAHQALANTLDVSNIKNMVNHVIMQMTLGQAYLKYFINQAVYHGKQAGELVTLLRTTLKQGVLTDGHVTDNLNSLTNVVRSSNVTIRWLMLHTVSNNYTGELQFQIMLFIF